MNDWQKYIEMWKAFKSQSITQDEWKAFCSEFFNNKILTDPEIVAVMKRLKDR